MTDLLAVVVTVPFLGAVVPLVLARRIEGVGWPVAAVTLTVETALAAWVAYRVTVDGPLSTVVGGLPAAVGIELGADRLTAAFLLLIPAVALWGLAYTRVAGPNSAPAAALYCLLVAGLAGITVTRDVFNLYVFLEISGLAAYALVATGGDRDAAAAALKYLLVGTVGASLYLLGVAYAYLATGTLNMADLAAGIAAVGYGDRVVLGAFGLMVVGLAVKVALYPVHTWKPTAYSDAPAGVTAVLAALVSTVAAYALLRLTVAVFGTAFFDAVPAASVALRAGAVVSIVVGALLALVQSDVRRMLAYSGVSQFGVAVAGLAVASPLAVVGAVLHLVGHAVQKAGAFAATGVLRRQTGAESVDDYAGLARESPVVAAALATLAFGLVGIPPMVGFFGKYYVALGAVEADAWGVAAAVLVSTLLSLTYYARLVQRLYLDAPPDDAPPPAGDRGPVSSGMVAAVVVAALTALALGVLSGAVADWLTPTVEEVLAS